MKTFNEQESENLILHSSIVHFFGVRDCLVKALEINSDQAWDFVLKAHCDNSAIIFEGTKSAVSMLKSKMELVAHQMHQVEPALELNNLRLTIE